jgi:hypothetical protein
LRVEEAYDAWNDWESVLKGFVEAYGLDSLYELMDIADPLTPRRARPTRGVNSSRCRFQREPMRLL